MEIKGKVIMILPLQSGNTQKGEWKKQEFVIETADQFPKKVCLSLWGDKAELIKSISENEIINVQFNVESREYNQRWFTELRAWKIDKSGESSSSTNTTSTGNNVGTSDVAFKDDEVGDLPF